MIILITSQIDRYDHTDAKSDLSLFRHTSGHLDYFDDTNCQSDLQLVITMFEWSDLSSNLINPITNLIVFLFLRV